MKFLKAAAFSAALTALPGQATPPAVHMPAVADNHVVIRIWPFASCPEHVSIATVDVYRNSTGAPYRRLVQFYSGSEAEPFLSIDGTDIANYVLTPGTVCGYLQRSRQLLGH